VRDPARIDRILDRLRTVWKAQPDMRLGQLLVVLLRPREPCPQVFSAEDTILEERLRNTAPDVRDTAIRLTHSEAVVLCGLLLRFRETDQLALEASAETQVLWDLCAILEERLAVEVANPYWAEQVERARRTVTESGE
jgi:hypothetical protein